jgi:phage FluMu protein Com
MDQSRGCEYCEDDQNVFFGHVEQMASSSLTGTILLRCPRCGWLYETTPRGDATTTRLSEKVAHERFAF